MLHEVGCVQSITLHATPPKAIYTPRPVLSTSFILSPAHQHVRRDSVRVVVLDGPSIAPDGEVLQPGLVRAHVALPEGAPHAGIQRTQGGGTSEGVGDMGGRDHKG